VDELLTAVLALSAAVGGCSMLWFFKSEMDLKKRKDAAKPTRVFADHARKVLAADFKEDVEEIDDALNDDNAANRLADMGNARSRRED